MNQLDLQKRLIKLTEYMREHHDMAGKGAEPSLAISVGCNLTWCGEIYSYLLNFEDGTRHHFVHAATYPELIDALDAMITNEEKKVYG